MELKGIFTRVVLSLHLAVAVSSSVSGSGSCSLSSPRFIQGSATQTPYSFYHWQYIDIFVYFSHHTVTIPPVGWTNAAHRHGVCVLGKSQGPACNPTRLVGTPDGGPSDEWAWAWGAVGWVDFLTSLDELGQVKANLFWKKEISSVFQATESCTGAARESTAPTDNKQTNGLDCDPVKLFLQEELGAGCRI